MPRIELQFAVEKQTLTLSNAVPLRAGNRNYFYAVFSLDNTWASVENIKAAFIRNHAVYIVLLEAGSDGLECKVPWEVMERDGNFEVGLFGGDRLLTNTVALSVENSFIPEGEESVAPTQDWFTKIEEAIANGGGSVGGSGTNGKDGVGIASVVQTTTSNVDGGSNVITVTKTDGTKSTFAVKNGSKGYTPVRGTDYWTAADIATIKSYVDSAILGGAW